MVGFLLPAWHQPLRKRQTTQPKFYFFDIGVKRALEHTVSQELYEGSYAFGNAFEHLIVLELVRANDYGRRDYRFSYVRSPSGVEVDLVIERPGKPVALVEIKSGTHVTGEDCAAAGNFASDLPGSAAYCVSRDPHRKKIGNVTCIPYQEMLDELGLGAAPPGD
jgi:predicted AAA+ superfamily ATPase